MANVIPLRFITLDTECFVCVSHSTNSDGYFRKRIGKNIEMFHRVMWKIKYGEIPDRHEVDHMCRNRACCNIKHLRVLSRPEHLKHTNETRYLDRKESARAMWLKDKPSGQTLADHFGVSNSAACGWIREWKLS